MTPIIGVTSTLKEDTEEVATRPLGTYVRTDFDYLNSVKEAGGAPLVLPPLLDEKKAISAMVCGLDGLVLSGGFDIHPSCYGEEAEPELGETLPVRDFFELAVLEAALERGIPVLGICRGMQLINVAAGGTLYQDIVSRLGGGVLNHRQILPKEQSSHAVRLEQGRETSALVGSRELEVNSYHHQAINRLGEGLVEAGYAPDGVIEAVEYADLCRQWTVGVQWHAEAMGTDASRRLFRAHVEAAERYALGRAA